MGGFFAGLALGIMIGGSATAAVMGVLQYRRTGPPR